jgi:hypothetical protein
VVPEVGSDGRTEQRPRIPGSPGHCRSLDLSHLFDLMDEELTLEELESILGDLVKDLLPDADVDALES